MEHPADADTLTEPSHGLKPWEEIIGELTAVHSTQADTVIIEVDDKKVSLPKSVISSIQPCVGEVISILRTNSGYRFRVIHPHPDRAND